MAARQGSAAGICRLYVSVSGRPHDARGSLAAVIAGLAANSTRTVSANAKDSRDSDFLRGRMADPGTPRGPGFAARLAGGTAFYLPPGTGAGEGPDATQAGLPISIHLE